jgi:magnesium transporter
MNSANCQLYHYDEQAFLMTKNTLSYYAANFVHKEIKHERVHWLNIHGLKERELIEELCKNVEIERLTIDEIYEQIKRPKLEEYPNYLFFSVKSALPQHGNHSLLFQEKISFVLNKDVLISFQEKSSDHFTDVRDRIEKKRGKIRQKGTDFLMYRLLDAIVENYFEVLDDISERIERIELIILKTPKSDTLKEVEVQKRKLMQLRKIVFPLKEIASNLEKLESQFIDPANRYYFSELKDNCLTILDEIDGNKQVLESLSSLYYASQGQRMNEIMKLLTVVSAIFIPLTFIVGVYGMNFKFMPELEMRYGYFIAWGIMVLIALVLLFYFQKRGWLNRR